MTKFKNKHPKLTLWLKLFILGCPFIPLVVLYFYYDPDMVLRDYKRFDQTHVFLKEAYVGWQNYIQNRDSIPYNSFIMGNSCTMAFKTQAWEKYLKKGSCAVRFFDNAETIGGIYQKIRALDSVGAKLDNILIIIDVKSLMDAKPLIGTSHQFSPEVLGISPVEFKLRSLQEFLYPTMSSAYIEYLITKKYSSRMKGLINAGPSIREPYTNNFINPREKEIQLKGETYWKEHEHDFIGERASSYKEEKEVIKSAQINVLKKIKYLCKKNNTNIKIIIGPDYFSKNINKGDLITLKMIFGEKAVWDFTGLNSFTKDYHNYYDSGHYRPFVGEKILSIIYK